MKFKKGSKVEFLDKRQTPFVAWRTAEIISGNGHTYVVRYDQCPPHGDTVLEKVRRKDMRPYPSVVGGEEDWAVGDVVEFFNRGSWKPAEVCGALDTDYYYVRLIGSSREFSARKSSLRSRRTWQDNNWVVVQKDAGKSRDKLLYDEGKPSYLLPNSCVDTLSSTRENPHVKNCVAAFGQPTGTISRCSKKRSSFCAPLSTYNCEERSKKKRILRKNGGHQDAAADQPVQLLDKVDAVVSPQKVLGEKYMHSSVKNRTAGFSKMELSKDISKFGHRYCRVMSEPSGAESISSSVGSCSSSSSPCRSSYNHVTNLHQKFCTDPDEADNSCSLRSESSFPIMESTQRKTHQLELHAYRSTLMALYASGPLSWEQEFLLTNLRLTLNISLDEHSSELKNLRCSEIAFY